MRAIWRKKLFEILRWPTLAVSAVTTAATVANASTDEEAQGWKTDSANLDPVVLPNTLNATATDRYAAHRSHRSHGSHRSHRSSSGGGYSPAPAPRTPPPSTTIPTVPKVQPAEPSIIPKPAPQDISMMVVRVQAALMRRGYFNGDIDGLLGPQMRSAIMAFQKAQGLPQSGRMDIDTLTKLGISIP